MTNFSDHESVEMRTTYLQWSYLTYLTGNCIAFTITLHSLWWSPELAIYKQIRVFHHPGFKVTLKLKYFILNNKFLRESISLSLLLRFYMQKLQKLHIFLQKKRKQNCLRYRNLNCKRVDNATILIV